jgi:PAS domain S-box-containing protein
LLDGEERTLRAAEDLLTSGRLGDASEPFGELTGQYSRLLRHVRSLIKVSDRMQIELNHLNDRLRKSELKYRSLFDNVSEGIFIAQLSGRFLDVNPAMAHTLGYGTPLEFLRVHEEDELWPFLDESEKERFIANLAEHGSATRLQTRMLHKDGSIIWVEINAHAHADDHSAPIMIVDHRRSDRSAEPSAFPGAVRARAATPSPFGPAHGSPDAGRRPLQAHQRQLWPRHRRRGAAGLIASVS